MPRTGGRNPFDKANALEGLARVLWAEITVEAPTGLVVSSVADADGEYAPITGWNDFGLATSAPSYTHGAEQSGLEYEQTGELFQKVTAITRSFQSNVAEIEPENMKLVENSSLTETVAAAANQSAATKLHIGRYSSMKQVRIALISYRPDAAGSVIEPAPSGRTRPPAVQLFLPVVQLAADDRSFEFAAGSPVSADIQFNVQDDQSRGSGKEHGYWLFETPGTISAA